MTSLSLQTKFFRYTDRERMSVKWRGREKIWFDLMIFEDFKFEVSFRWIATTTMKCFPYFSKEHENKMTALMYLQWVFNLWEIFASFFWSWNAFDVIRVVSTNWNTKIITSSLNKKYRYLTRVSSISCQWLIYLFNGQLNEFQRQAIMFFMEMQLQKSLFVRSGFYHYRQ